MDARSAREWSSEAAARAICPNSLRQRSCISEETGKIASTSMEIDHYNSQRLKSHKHIASCLVTTQPVTIDCNFFK